MGETIPYKLEILHICDNGFCVNPCHLKLGTHSDNMQDMLSKGRQNYTGPIGVQRLDIRGSKNPNSKFTNEEIIKIRDIWDGSSRHIFKLAMEYNVLPETIRNIVLKRSYKDAYHETDT